MLQVSVLVVDGEAAARDELCFLLRTELSVAHVETARSSAEALRRGQQRRFAVVFTDVRIPGLDGIELASLLHQLAAPPAVVFVTAHEEYAVRAFEVGACDYLLKPASRSRLAVALNRALDRAPASGATARDPSATIPVEAGGRTRLISRDAVHWVEAQGDYVRLHVADGEAHLIRMPISRLQDIWEDFGFIRIHRSYLVAASRISEFSTADGNPTVTVAGESLPVSRRHVRTLRDRFRWSADSGRSSQRHDHLSHLNVIARQRCDSSWGAMGRIRLR